MVISSINDTAKDVRNMSKVDGATWLSECVVNQLETNGGGPLFRFKTEDGWKFITREVPEGISDREAWVKNYYITFKSPINIGPIIYNDALLGGNISAGTIVIGTGIPAANNPILSSGITIMGQIPVTRSPISLIVSGQEVPAVDLKLTWNKCIEVLSNFAVHAKEFLKYKKIEMTETKIRNWQAIEDSNWKQCILEITIKTEPIVALKLWDELAEELQQFINVQPEIIRHFVADKLSLDIKWI